jgi:hypothetical protein
VILPGSGCSDGNKHWLPNCTGCRHAGSTKMRLDAARRAFGLPPNKKTEIDEDDLKKIYRKEAIKCHPDKCPGDANATARFQELSEAYQILTGQADPSEDEWSSDEEWTHGTKNAGRQRSKKKKKKEQPAKSEPKQRRQRKSRGKRGGKAAQDFFEDLFGVRDPLPRPCCMRACVRLCCERACVRACKKCVKL